MKMFSAIRSMAVAAIITVSAIATAAPTPKAKVYVNSYSKPNYAVVSVVPESSDEITKMEVTDETGTIVYVTKRISNVKSAQYLLDIAKLSDGVYNVTFTFRKSGEVSKTFVIDNNSVVK